MTTSRAAKHARWARARARARSETRSRKTLARCPSQRELLDAQAAVVVDNHEKHESAFACWFGSRSRLVVDPKEKRNPSPTARYSATASGRLMLPDESLWRYAARLFYAWNSRRQAWDFIGQIVEPYRHPSFFATTGNVIGDIDNLLGGASLYENTWVAETDWVWTDRWYRLDSSVQRS
jgi:hypothetical protein